jgi:hypothetical protein
VWDTKLLLLSLLTTAVPTPTCVPTVTVGWKDSTVAWRVGLAKASLAVTQHRRGAPAVTEVAQLTREVAATMGPSWTDTDTVAPPTREGPLGVDTSTFTTEVPAVERGNTALKEPKRV